MDDGKPRNARADTSHGFVTQDGTSPAKLLRDARAQLVPYTTVSLVNDRVRRIAKRTFGFAITTTSGATFRGRRLLLTTGVLDVLPEIRDIEKHWGKSVFVCPFCDGWEVRERRIASYGKNREAVELAQELAGWSDNLVVVVEHDDLTARDRRWLTAAGVGLHLGRPLALEGAGDSLEGITFHDGSAVACGALFLSAPLRQHSPLFKQLGCKLDTNGLIKVNRQSLTTIPGCYAAGDAVTQHHQIVIAAASGAGAAISIACKLLENEAQTIGRA